MKLPLVGCSRGAPMGRVCEMTNVSGKVRLFKVSLDSGGYDSGGAYWGHGQRLYACIGEGFAYYLRSSCRELAKSDLVVLFPSLRFYR